MSLFLGKIHFWLFDKIRWFENIELEVLELAKEHNMPVDKWVNYTSENFGEITPNKPLDNLIDEGNIHGWLESRIQSAERRGAYYITEMIKIEPSIKEEIGKIYSENGVLNADECKLQKEEWNAQDIYTNINNYILDGMPCDRINEIIVNSEEKVSWRMREDLHKRFWDEVSGDVEVFHYLRSLWIKAFVNELNSRFKFVQLKNREFSIEE